MPTRFRFAVDVPVLCKRGRRIRISTRVGERTVSTGDDRYLVGEKCFAVPRFGFGDNRAAKHEIDLPVP